MENLQFESDELYLDRIRDGFLFSCYTSLRDESTRSLTTKLFYQDNGNYYLRFTANKTSKTSRIPLSKLYPIEGSSLSKPELLLEKAITFNKKFYGRAHKSQPLFGKMNNQFRNKKLKVIASRAKINKNLTTHTGRHTFGTHMANKIPAHLLQAIMQHSSYKTTLAYINHSDKLIDDGLDNVQW